MNNQLGAHELLEVHEVMQSMIDGINMFKMYSPYVKDGDLEKLVAHQMGFVTNEYNKFVNNLGSITESVRSYGVNTQTNPEYGLRGVMTQQPISSTFTLSDKDIGFAILGFHKNGAKIKLHAALECADPELKIMLVESSNNCVYQAFDIWTYMNKKGYYQVPTFNNDVSHAMINMYEPLVTNLGSRYLTRDH